MRRDVLTGASYAESLLTTSRACRRRSAGCRARTWSCPSRNTFARRIARATGGCNRTRCSKIQSGSRYLIEYETGSATVRNAQHKTATLTKLARYSHFILGFADAHGRATYYSKHFADGFTPVVLFIARTAVRRETIAEAVAGWAGGEMSPRFQVRSLMVEQACAEFRALILGEKPTVPAQATTAAPAGPPSRASQDGVLLSWKELELLQRFQAQALHAIQRVRHTVRAGQPVVSEPRYPEQTTAAERLLRWLLALRPAKAQ